jgi:hypothetical protein
MRLAFLSNPSMVARTEVYLACLCIHTQKILFLAINVKHLYGIMPTQSTHTDTTPVVRNVRNLANRQNQQKCGPSGNSQLPLTKTTVSLPAGTRDSSQGGSSVRSTIQGQNYTHSSSLNNSRVADITQRVTSTPSATQRRSIITPTAMPGTISRNTPAPSGTIQTDSTRHVESNPASGIAGTPTPLSSVENLPTPIPNPEDHGIIKIHCERQLTKCMRVIGSGNCNHRPCLHLDQWSPAVAASIDLVTPT